MITAGVVVGAVGHLVDRLGAAEQLLELAGLDERCTRRPPRAAPASGRLGELVPGDEHRAPASDEVVGDLARLEQRVHRHDDRAEAQRAVVDDREVRDVRAAAGRRGRPAPTPFARSSPAARATRGVEQPRR